MMEEFRVIKVAGVIFQKVDGNWMQMRDLGFRTCVEFGKHILYTVNYYTKFQRIQYLISLKSGIFPF